MLSIVCRGLELYYEITGDERIAEAIVGGANQAVDEMWRADLNDFAPTSCPDILEAYPAWKTAHFPVPVQMLLFAHLRTGKPHYLDIARRVIAHTPLEAYHWIPWWTKAFSHMDQIERNEEKQR